MPTHPVFLRPLHPGELYPFDKTLYLPQLSHNFHRRFGSHHPCLHNSQSKYATWEENRCHSYSLARCSVREPPSRLPDILRLLLTYVAIISGSPASAYGVYASSSYLRTWKIHFTR
jgi:hypothetical protein